MTFRQKLKFGATALALAPLSVFAATDPAVVTAITDTGVDGAKYVGYMAVAGAAMFLIKRALSKLGII